MSAQLTMLIVAAILFAGPGSRLTFAQEPSSEQEPSALVTSIGSSCLRRLEAEKLGAPTRRIETSPFDRLFTAECRLDVRLPADPAPFQGQAATPPPPPAHTGFAALAYTTAADFKAFPRRTSTWVILGIGAGAAALASPADGSANARLAGSPAVGRFFAPGKYIGAFYTQLGAAAGLYVVGRYVLPAAEGQPRTNKVSHLGFDLVRGLIVSQAFTQGIKITVRRDRPTGECCSFPSGHASAAFATASILERHLGYRAAWPTLVVASYVAASRLHDNRHFVSDVVFGSALGMASGWTVVGRHGRREYAVVPVPTRGGFAVAVMWTPGRSAPTAEVR